MSTLADAIRDYLDKIDDGTMVTADGAPVRDLPAAAQGKIIKKQITRLLKTE